MQAEKSRKLEDERGRKSEVNPAARHDRAEAPAIDPAPGREKQVPPVQEEPLDPLGPGGIGS